MAYVHILNTIGIIINKNKKAQPPRLNFYTTFGSKKPNWS